MLHAFPAKVPTALDPEGEGVSFEAGGGNGTPYALEEDEDGRGSADEEAEPGRAELLELEGLPLRFIEVYAASGDLSATIGTLLSGLEGEDIF